MNKRKRYDTPPTGWQPAESFPGHIVHWDGPSVVVGPGLILVSTFRRKDGITVENMVDGAMLDTRELVDLAERIPEAHKDLADRIVKMHEEVKRAENEVNG